MGTITLKGMSDFNASGLPFALASWNSVLLFGVPSDVTTVRDLGNGVTEVSAPAGTLTFGFRIEVQDYQTGVIDMPPAGDPQVAITGGTLNVLEMSVQGGIEQPDQVTLRAADLGIDIATEAPADLQRAFLDTSAGRDAQSAAAAQLRDVMFNWDWVIKGRNSDDLITRPDEASGQLRLSSGDDGLANVFPGNDTVLGRGGNDTLWLRTGNDIGRGGKGNDTVYGGDGNDQLYGNAGKDRLFGDRGADSLFGGANKDLLKGGNNADVLMGGAGNDRLVGGNGNDRLSGGKGNDILKGGNGRDTFEFFSTGLTGDDVIKGFQQGRDVVEAASTYLEDFADALRKASDETNGVRIQFNEDSSVLIEGLTRADLQQGDFFILSF
ncbi:MAG: calcium-binding protein [Arenibacterium sp.]